MDRAQTNLLVLSQDDAIVSIISELVNDFEHPEYDLDMTVEGDISSSQVQLCKYDICFIDARLTDGDDLGVIERIKFARKDNCERTIVFWNPDGECNMNSLVQCGLADYILRGEMDKRLLEQYFYYAMHRHRVIAKATRTSMAYDELLDNAQIGIFQTSPDGKYLRVNKALAEIYGYDNIDDLQRELTDIGGQLYVQGRRRKKFAQMMARDGAVTKFKSRVYRKDGSIIKISEDARRVLDQDGNLLYYEGFVENISDRYKRVTFGQKPKDGDDAWFTREKLIRQLRSMLKSKPTDHDMFTKMYIDTNNWEVAQYAYRYAHGDELMYAGGQPFTHYAMYR